MSRLARLRLTVLLSVIALNVSAAHACGLCGSPSTDHSHGISQGLASDDTSEVAAAAPSLSSRPGAAYTVYLNFDGFAFNGQWGNTGATPGITPAYSGTQAQIREVWARTAEKYVGFNVNVTTVDPAIAAGQAGSDSARQRYYDTTSRVMHTVIGGNGAWFGGGGVSYVGVTANAYSGTGTTNGFHTNWTFASLAPNNLQFVADVTTHENGHGFGLNHQGDSNIPGAGSREYSNNGGAVGNGSYAPLMGNSYSSQRSTWRTGSYYNSATGVITQQNDVRTHLNNSGLTLLDDGIGHSFANATALPLIGASVDATLAQGFINPISSANPNPIGIDNYTKDYFKFSMGQSGNVTLNLANGGDWLTNGVASVGATLRSKLNIYSSSDRINPFAFGVEAANTLSSSFSGLLSAGDYFAEITSFGGYSSTYDTNAKYFDMGSYVLSGSGILPAVVVVPESGTVVLIGIGLVGLLARRRIRRK
jgi:hypothetical protein